MRQRGVLHTEWIECWDCYCAVLDHFKAHAMWKGRSNGQTFYAWRLGASDCADGNDANQFAVDEKPSIEGAICHPVVIAVLQGDNSQVFHLQPRKPR